MTSNQILSCANDYRGRIIDATITLERMVDFYIAEFFTNDPERQNALIFLILSNERMSYEAKRQVFRDIVKVRGTPFPEHPGIVSELEDIGRNRNILAHYLLDLSDEAESLPDGTVRFHKLRTNHSYETFTHERIELLHVNIQLLIDAVQSKLRNDPRSQNA